MYTETRCQPAISTFNLLLLAYISIFQSQYHQLTNDGANWPAALFCWLLAAAAYAVNGGVAVDNGWWLLTLLLSEFCETVELLSTDTQCNLTHNHEGFLTAYILVTVAKRSLPYHAAAFKWHGHHEHAPCWKRTRQKKNTEVSYYSTAGTFN